MHCVLVQWPPGPLHNNPVSCEAGMNDVEMFRVCVQQSRILAPHTIPLAVLAGMRKSLPASSLLSLLSWRRCSCMDWLLDFLTVDKWNALLFHSFRAPYDLFVSLWVLQGRMVFVGRSGSLPLESLLLVSPFSDVTWSNYVWC